MNEIIATRISTKYGLLDITYHTIKTRRYISLSCGDVTQGVPLVRLQSACLFGESFKSLHCDCGQQLEKAFEMLEATGSGVIIYALDEEGRGIGLANKIMAMQLESDEGIDTVDSFLKLGFTPDERDFEPVAKILQILKIPEEIKLLTSNPKKVEGLTLHGFRVVEVIPLEVGKLGGIAARELQAKRNKLGYY